MTERSVGRSTDKNIFLHFGSGDKMTNLRTYSNDDNLVANRREGIAKAASTLFIKKGYIKTTIREIAEACDISIGTLYHYIGSKDDILYLLSDISYKKSNQLVEQVKIEMRLLKSTDKMRLTLQKYLQHVDEYQDMIVFWFQEAKNMRGDARDLLFKNDYFLINLFNVLLRDGQKSGEFKEFDVNLISNNIIVMCDIWAFRRWYLRKNYTFEEFKEKQIKSILNMVCKEEVT